jgi:hypothetical protein
LQYERFTWSDVKDVSGFGYRLKAFSFAEKKFRFHMPSMIGST